MEIINANLQILATLGSALAVYGFIRLGARREAKEIKSQLVVLELQVKSIDQRLIRLEGRFEERGYWQSRAIKQTGTDSGQ